MSGAKLPQEQREIFADVYGFYERHWDMPDTAEAWEACASELGPISTKHGNTPLVQYLLTACYDAIDRDRKIVREALRNG